MKIVLATRNKNKITEFCDMLCEYIDRDITVLSLDDIGYRKETEENGKTFAENALIKANAPKCRDYPVIADDSGLCVPALGGAPGIYSARYSGEGATDKSNNEKLISAMSGLSGDDRIGYYEAAVVCVLPNGHEPIVCEGRCYGKILSKPQGDGGFGYDPYFYVEEYKKTFAQITLEEKNMISHRGIALRELCKKLSDILSNGGYEA